MKKNFTVIFSMVLVFFLLQAEENDTKSIVINQWLKTGTVNLNTPLFSCEKDAQGNAWSKKEFLNNENFDLCDMKPAEKAKIQWDSEKTLNWNLMEIPEITYQNIDTSKYAVAFASFYIYADQWMEVELKLKSSSMLKLLVDGKEVAKKETIEQADDEIKSFDNKIKLETGKHLILIKTVGKAANWTLSGEFATSEMPILCTNPTNFMSVDKLLYAESVRGAKISFDGEYSAITLAKVNPDDKSTETWLEIRNSDNGELVQSFRGGMKISSVTWSPNNNDFIYRSYDDGKTTLWLANIESGKNEPILKDVKSLGSIEWSPTGNFLIYSINQEGKEDETGVRLLRNMPDRQPGSRDISHLYKHNIKSKTSRRLTFGELSAYCYDISEDGKKAIISRFHPFVMERPFSLSDFYIMNTKTLELDSLFSLKWASSLQWSPDGEKILVTGGVSMFNGIGKNLPVGMTPNDYDGQAFIYYIKSKKVLPVTKNFNPAITDAYWSKINDNIYFVVEDRSWRQLYEYNVDKNRFSKLNIGMEAIRRFDLAEQEAKGIYYGSSASETFKVCTIDLNKKSFLGIKQDDFKVIYKPGKATYKNIKLSNVTRWTFENKDGVEIEGRYYLPPNFDESKNIPVLYIITAEPLRFLVILTDDIHTITGQPMVM